MNPTARLVGLVLVAVVIGFGVGYWVGPGPDPSAGLEWEATADGCTKVSIAPGAGDVSYAIIPDDGGEPIKLDKKTSPVVVCGSFKIYKVSAAQQCANGACEHYEDYPVPFPPSE